jgi:small subunit ribosomal protein S24e
MEIEIDSKRNNPLLNRTEIYFTIKHEGEGTPNRELIRSELADKLNVKKENIIVNTVDSSFGKQEISGYAKVYSSIPKAKDIENDHILKRNLLIEGEKKPVKKEEPPAPAPQEDKPAGEVEAGEPPKEEAPAEPPKEEVPAPPEPTGEEPSSEKTEEKTPEEPKPEVKEEVEPKKEDKAEKEPKEDDTSEKEQADKEKKE